MDDASIVDELRARIDAAGRAPQREQLVEFLVAVDPSGPTAHGKVAQLMLALLARNTKVDFDLALRAAPALGRDHRHSEKLRHAFSRAADENKFRIPPKNLISLHAANVRPKKKSLADSASDAFKRLWGGGG